MANPPVHARMVEMSAFSDDDEESDSDFLVRESLHHCPSLCQVCRPILTLSTTPLHLLLHFHICQSAYRETETEKAPDIDCLLCRNLFINVLLFVRLVVQPLAIQRAAPSSSTFANLHRETERIEAEVF